MSELTRAELLSLRDGIARQTTWTSDERRIGFDAVEMALRSLSDASAIGASVAVPRGPVAWMYRHPTAEPVVQFGRWAATGTVWSETPLYAAPAVASPPACAYPEECKAYGRCIKPDDHDHPPACAVPEERAIPEGWMVLPEDLFTHINDWESACEIAMDSPRISTMDRSYYEKQLRTVRLCKDLIEQRETSMNSVTHK